jgi:hypothetical protein
MSVQRGSQGFELGAASVNTILTFGVLIVGAAVTLIAEYPAVPVVPMMIAGGGAAVLLPVLFYPFTYTIWFAVELLVDPPSPAAMEEAALFVEGRNALSK